MTHWQIEDLELGWTVAMAITLENCGPELDRFATLTRRIREATS